MSLKERAKAHPSLLCLGALLALCVAAEIVLLVWASHLRGEAKKRMERAVEMEELAREYRRLKAEAAVPVVASRGVLSLAAVDRVAQQLGISPRINAMRALPAVAHSQQLQELVISLSLVGVREGELARFLFAVEQLDPAIRTKSLRISEPSRTSSVVDAKVEFSAYEALPVAASQ